MPKLEGFGFPGARPGPPGVAEDSGDHADRRDAEGRYPRAKKLGAADYLLKSRFSPDVMLDRVRRRLNPAAATPAPAAGFRPGRAGSP